MSRVRYDSPVLTDVATIETTHPAIQTPGGTYAELMVTFGAATSAGIVTLEESDDPNFAGLWHPLGTVAWAAASTKVALKVVGPFKYLRARVSTAAVGGTLSARLHITD